MQVRVDLLAGDFARDGLVERHDRRLPRHRAGFDFSQLHQLVATRIVRARQRVLIDGNGTSIGPESCGQSLA